MKKAIISGILAAMMLTSTATTLVTSADNCVTAPETTQASKKSTRVKLDRLKDCTISYPEFAKICGEPYVTELTKNRTIKGKLELYDGETLYIPSGMTLTLNGDSALYGGTLFVEKGAKLVLKKSLYIYDGASLICDGSLNAGKGSNIHVRNGGIFYTSPKSTVKLNAQSYLYSDDEATSVCLGEVNKTNGVTDDIRCTFIPSVVSAVKTTSNLFGDVLSSEVVSADSVKKTLSAKWYTLSELPSGVGGEMLTVLFDNGSAMKFSFMSNRLLGIQGTSVRDIWYYAPDRLYDMADDVSSSDGTDYKMNFSAGQMDTAASESSNVVTAKLDSFEANPDTVDYWFTVTDQFKGETEKKICVKRDREWSDEYTQEFDVGTEYLLFLNSVDYVYRDLYYTLTYSIFAPIKNGNLAIVIYNGGKYTPSDEISTIKKVSARVKENADISIGKPIGGDYLHSTDINQVIKSSPYIVKVKITDDIEKFRESSDISIFTVELEQSYKLTPETPLKIILPNDKVKVGEEYVIMLYPYSGWAQKHYMESSRISVYKPDDPTLKSAMEKADLYL